MDKERSDYRPAASTPVEGTLVRHIRYKPVLGSLIISLLGAAALLIPNTVGRLAGIVLIAAALYVIFFVRNSQVMDIYTGGILAHADNNDSLVLFLPYGEISQWSVKRSGSGTQVVMLMLRDGQYVYKETFEMAGIRRVLLKYLPEKEFTAA